MKILKTTFMSLTICMVVLTVSANPGIDNLTRIGIDNHQFAHVMDIRMDGSFAYASIGWNGGLETYSIDTPDNPIFNNAMGSAAWRNKIFGDLLVSFNRRAGLELYLLSDSAPPDLIGEIATGGTLIGFESGDIIGPTLYVAAHQTGIIPIDLTIPSQPVVGTAIDLTHNDAWGAEGNSEYLFVANGRAGLSVLRHTPSIMEVATLDLPGLANDIILSGTTLFLALGGDGIAAVSVSDPENPVLLDIAPTMGNAFSLGLEGDMLVVGAWRYLELYDVSNPADIRLTGWDHTRTYAMGADIGLVHGSPVISVADWRGISTYEPAPDPGPDIDVIPARVDFGIDPENPVSRDVSILNNGLTDLVVTSVDLPQGVTIQPTTFSVSPGGTVNITLTVDAGIPVRGSARYNSTDPDEPAWIQYLYANDSSFPHLGTQAPEFTLSDISGTEHSLSDFRGKVVVLQWGASW